MFSLGSRAAIVACVETSLLGRSSQQMWLQLLGAELCLYHSPCCHVHTCADAGAEACLLMSKGAAAITGLQR